LVSPQAVFKFVPRLVLLYFLFLVIYVIASMLIALPGMTVPETAGSDGPAIALSEPVVSETTGSEPIVSATAGSEPGLVSPTTGLLIIGLINLLIIVPLIKTSRWGGWKLALILALSYYGAVTFIVQLESWFFLTANTVGAQMLPRLFLMGIPPAFFFIPLAVWILGKNRSTVDPTPNPVMGMPIRQWAWKLPTIVAAYIVLYWLAGYFIAWQNPVLRAFYGQPGPALPFFEHTLNTLRDFRLFALQILRALLYVLCMIPVIRGSRVNPWWTALLVGAFLSLPQNIGLILENPLLPSAVVRLTHLIETVSSNFIWGLFMVWLFHREHPQKL
jgi:hypothetical protein